MSSNNSEKINLFGLTFNDLKSLCQEEGFPKFTAKQLCDWLYSKNCRSFEEMTNLSLKIRSRLSEIASIDRWDPISEQLSKDGTRKYLFEAGNGQYIETVMIPTEDRATLCISCQMGCRMGCKFCVTGQQGFHGNLTTGQILNQIFSVPNFSEITNVVYMGMGEPMDNYDSILKSTQILTEEWGLGWSPKRITVSSVGITPKMKKFIQESSVHMAVSLHNPFDSERAQIMPAQKAYPLRDLLSMLEHYNWTGQRRISFEYTMFKGLNDSLRHAQELVDILKEIPCRVNLIRFHSSPNTPFKTCDEKTMNSFRDYLNNHGVTCTIRASRGEDIMAACGLLAGQKKKERED